MPCMNGGGSSNGDGGNSAPADDTTIDTAATVRHIGPRMPAAAVSLAPRYLRSWAVVVGINRYQSEDLRDLGYAVSDALGMAQLLVTRLGFPREQVFIALDPWPDEEVPWGVRAGDATKAVIESLLFTRMPEMAGPNDRVLVFFAGHGERRHLPSGSNEAGYLIPSDAVADQWHTCIDLDAVTRAGNLCAAKHVFYLIDACYSGLATARASVQDRRYEETMMTTRARQVLTAGTALQTVADRGPQGHSLFTWYVLQGLKGGANLFDQGVITGSQLMVYVRDQVARAYGSAQMPDFGVLLGHESGGDFVFVEPQFGAADHLALGHALVALAQALQDPGRLRAAARAFQAAVELGGASESAAWRALGDTQMAQDDPRAAATSLRRARALGDDSAALSLAMAEAQLRDMPAAIAALNDFVAAQPDDLDASWARELAAHWRRSGGARRLALLIGSGSSASADMKDWREMLLQRFGFCPRDVRLVCHERATYEGIVQALAQLARDATPVDEVLVYFAGTGTIMPVNDQLNYQTVDRQQFAFLNLDFRKQILLEQNIVEALARIQGHDRLLIADAPHFALEPGHAARVGWRFIGACGRHEASSESVIDGRQRGVFSYHLLNVLAESGPGGLHYRDALRATRKRMVAQGLPEARPVSIGAMNDPVWPSVAGPDLAWLHSLSLALNWDHLDKPDLIAWQAMLSPGSQPTPARSALALAGVLSKRGQDDQACAAVDHAVEHGLKDDLPARLLQVRVLARALHPARALAMLQAWVGADVCPPDPGRGERLALHDACVPWLERLERDDRRALLVGVGKGAGGAEVPGVANDLLRVRRMLVRQLGFARESIVTLADAAATSDAVREAFLQLLGSAESATCFFYFSGRGSVDADGEPVLRLADASARDIPLSELRELAAPMRENLITLIDAGFTVDSDDPRFAEPAPTQGMVYWGFDPRIQRKRLERYQIGRCSVFPASLRLTKLGRATESPGRGARRVTHSFTAALGGDGSASSTSPWHLRQELADHVVLGGESQYPLFRNRLVLGRLYAALDQVTRVPLRDAVRLLEKLRHAGGGDDGRVLLELGLAQQALTEHAVADALLVEAIERLDNPLDRADTHHHLARRLLKAGQPDAAATHLKAVIADDPGRVKAHYDLGLALQRLIDQDLSQRIQESWRTCLALGASGPLEAEVRNVLAQRARNPFD